MLDDLKFWIKSKKFKTNNYQTKYDDSIKLFWWNKVNNFGDLVNKVLVEKMSQKIVEWVPSNYNNQYYMAIGSVIHLAHAKSIIWGSGLSSSKAMPIQKPHLITAVRGPLTRNRLLEMHITCPEVFGDPALLLPEYYHPDSNKIYELGIIPHYVDKNHPFFNQLFPDEINIINVDNYNPLIVIEEILKCKKIVSSSLHGIIIADAYHIPALQITLSKKIVGGNFKFKDYFLSVNRNYTEPHIINNQTDYRELLDYNYDYSIKIETEALKQACPFI